MQDKKKLIESMENLIAHIGASRKNQQQIYETLSIADFRKIISNLEDPNETLRKTTLGLISELLYNNTSLQKRFCQLMQIAPFPGKIVLSSKFPRNMIIDPGLLAEVVKLLKDTSEESRDKGLFWYIDSHSRPVVLKMGHRNSFIIDPLQCIFGVWMSKAEDNSTSQLPQKKFHHIERKTDPRSISQQKARLNRSSHFNPDSKPQTPISNNYMAQSMRIQNQFNHSHTQIKPRHNIHSQFIKPTNSDRKNGYNSQHQEYSFTYIKPSTISSIGVSNTTRHSNTRPVEGYTRWDPNKQGPLYGRR